MYAPGSGGLYAPGSGVEKNALAGDLRALESRLESYAQGSGENSETLAEKIGNLGCRPRLTDARRGLDPREPRQLMRVAQMVARRQTMRLNRSRSDGWLFSFFSFPPIS
jgi:hypothetical protein